MTSSAAACWPPHRATSRKLLPQLEPRAEELAGLAARRLRERKEREARDLDETLRRQRDASSRSRSATRDSTSRSRWRSTRKSGGSSRRTPATGARPSTSSTVTWSGSQGGFGRSTMCRHGASNRSASCTSGRGRIEVIPVRINRRMTVSVQRRRDASRPPCAGRRPFGPRRSGGRRNSTKILLWD